MERDPNRGRLVISRQSRELLIRKNNPKPLHALVIKTSDGDVVIDVQTARGGWASISINAPRHVGIMRSELVPKED